MAPETLRRGLVVFAPISSGGIPHYTHHQAQELARRGIAVTMLCRPDHPWAGADLGYRQIRRLAVAPLGRGPLLTIGKVAVHVWMHFQLLWWVLRLRPSVVLFEANTEFLAALWAWPHFLMRLLGVTYIITLHDPVRGLWPGMKTISRISRWAAYRLVSGGLIHGNPPPGAYLPARLKLESVPHGLFDHLAPQAPAFDVRARLGIAADAFVVLSFGQISDRKNQHLLVEAVAQVPGAVLVIAGAQASRRDRPPVFYADLAQQLGCEARVHVVDAFIAENEVGAWFAAADAVALTYASWFVSQSGIIQIAAQWDKPVLTSSGEGPLRETVEDFGIGLFVPPDDARAVAKGIEQLMRGGVTSEEGFARFRDHASWGANVDGMLRLIERCAKD